jgi:undecaprenyl-diphosphatase
VDLLTHYLQIILLGIVEGVTEFLPISSTGHLLIAEHLLGTSEPDVFNVVIQAGAILAVVFIYWHKIIDLLSNLESLEARQYVFKLVVAFIVTGAIGFTLTKLFHLNLPETLVPVAWATLIGGLVIFAVELFSKNLYPHDDVSWPEAILIGLAQILAGIFPGTSRSGATIMTGLAMGMKRPAATEFSFLVGIPTMFAASVLEIVKYRKDLTTGGHQLLIDIALGFIISAIVAFFVVKWLLKFVISHTFNGFAIYRVLLGGGLLIAIALDPSLSAVGQKEKAKPTVIQVQTEPVQIVVPATPAIHMEASPKALPVDPADMTNTNPSVPATNTDATPASPATNVPTPQN